MYNPCQECRNRYDREYSEKCNSMCHFAMVVKSLKDTVQKQSERIDQLEEAQKDLKEQNARAKALILSAANSLM